MPSVTFTTKVGLRKSALRHANERIVLGAVRQSPSISRADLVRITGLSPSSVSFIVNRLVRAGLILEELVEDHCQVGRRPTALHLAGDAILAIGVRVSRAGACVALADIAGTVRSTKTVAFHPSPEIFAHRTHSAVRAVLERAPANSVLGAAVALPGTIERSTGKVIAAENLGWFNVEAGRLFRDKLPIPFYFENAAKASALAEQFFQEPHTRPFHDFIVITPGEGLGTGIISNGQLLQGSRSMGGEFGHVVLYPEGRECTCGNRGCWEQYVCAPALERAYAEAAGAGSRSAAPDAGAMYTQMWRGDIALSSTGGPWQSSQAFFIENNVPSISFPNPFLTTSEFSGLQDIRSFSPSFPAERSHQWNVSFGRQLGGTALNFAYIGTKALNIPYSEDLNLLPPSTEPYSSARRPYQLFNQVQILQTGGSSIYHGFNFQAERRLARGLGFNVNYTFAKSITDTGLTGFGDLPQQNQYARYLERADDPFIRRHTFNASYFYELPIGRGRRFLSGLPGVANQIIGGWQIAGITTMMTGPRRSPGFSDTDPANTNQFGGRPDRIGDGNFDSGEMRDRIRSGQPIFDESAFVAPANGRGFYGNSARNILTGPGRAVWNTVLAKNFHIGETARAQFRWEMFNAFNRANFDPPDTNINGGAFGLVTSAGPGRRMLFGIRLDY